MPERIIYKVIRSRRRTIELSIRGSELIVRAPLWSTDREISSFVESRRGWIEKHLRKAALNQAEAQAAGRLTEAEIRELAEKAMQVIPERVKYYASKMGVKYGRITIRNQKTRWGSCSAKGNLNFNCLLMLTPPMVIDSVVVHELCHLKEMNHSDKFYAEVLRVFPEYFKWHGWLKEHGGALMQRMW